jgi:hypothetical protein
MKKLLFCGLCLAPLLGISQGKNIYSSMIVTPKTAQALNFENSIKPHVAKFHSTNHKVIVFEILSGDKTGSYQIVEGPFSWAEMDEIPPGREHFQDVEMNLAPKVEKNYGRIFSVRVDSLSYGTMDMNVEKSRMLLFTLKPGQLNTVLGLMAKIKEGVARLGDTKRNATIYVKLLEDVAGSRPQVIIIRRFPTGWKEMEDGYVLSVKDIITRAYSENYWQEWYKAISDAIESSESCLRMRRTDLSSQ